MGIFKPWLGQGYVMRLEPSRKVATIMGVIVMAVALGGLVALPERRLSPPTDPSATPRLPHGAHVVRHRVPSPRVRIRDRERAQVASEPHDPEDVELQGRIGPAIAHRVDGRVRPCSTDPTACDRAWLDRA